MELKKLAVAVALACGAAGSMAVPTTISGAKLDIGFDDGFTAQTSGGIAVTNSSFAFTVTAHDGFQLDSLARTEGFFFGGGNDKHSGVKGHFDQGHGKWHPGWGHVSPIPEPGTYALMLAGLAAVGFVVARRRRRAD